MLKGLLEKSAKRKRNRVRPGRGDTLLRVRARQSETRRAKALQWARIFGGLLAAGLLFRIGVSGARGISHSLYRNHPRYAIRVLDIQSDGAMPVELIRRFGGISVGMNLFDLDIQALRKNIEGLPIVRSARVERKLPDTLVVRVSERISMARIAAEGGVVDLGVDREGMLLGPTYAFAHLPRIEAARVGSLFPGDRIARPDLLDAIALVDLCDSTRLGQIVRIVRIRVAGDDPMTLCLASGDVVSFPRQQMKSRLLSLAGALKAIQDQRLRQGGRLFHIDMTTEKNVPIHSLAE